MSDPTRSDHGPPSGTVITPAVLREWALPAPRGGAKASRGTALVVGGSRGTPGAVLLAGVAALRAGAGVLQLGAPASIATALGVSVPESLALPLPESPAGCVAADAVDDLAQVLPAADAVLVGPGLFDDEPALQALVTAVLGRVRDDATVVLDGYALRGLEPGTVAALGGRLVVTPNAGETEALLDGVPDAPEPGTEAAAAAVAERLDAVVASGGRIVTPDGRRWADGSGHAGLGTSGSGDVLAGLVVGLLARGATPAQAACWATHVHATAGERLGTRISHVGFLARELLDEAPLVMAELSS
ncbi:NAD(P)H-hydrate dehydratase [Pseudonocardia sp. D17]|uniref:NAD(P)H-hydrate dehydratase n=1 Tax=Pseudonocardia sp. D17 TaxID=882661 RepID=UPI002B3F53A1|nr:ADP-dependent (S)-NAD(P)H-hydrate dehydratase [Pseudonocardia sp. D17]